MTPFPFVLGPTDDWDPQGYNDAEEELEDELMKAGMSEIKEEDVEKPIEVLDEEAEAKEAEEVEEAKDVFEDVALDPLAALDDLADQVNRTERETLRFKVDFDE
ncbi:MAG: hypothetical protein WC750_05505 [Patescibacteria group bacterium]|jgi:hypothetical protein